MASAMMEILKLHRKQVQGLVEIRGVRKMSGIYAQAEADLRRQIERLIRRGRRQSFTAQQMRVILAQVQDAIRVLEAKMAAHMGQTGRMAATLAPAHVVQSVERFSEVYSGASPVLQLRDASVMQGLVKDVDASLLNRYKQSSRFYGPPVIERIKNAMAQSILQNDGVDAAVDKVVGTDGVFSSQRWRAERIVRTEAAYAYGVTKQRSMEVTRKDMPDLQKKLVATWDSRTGDDSKELDGQTVPIDEPFVWVVKNSKGQPTGKVVRYMQPPNRPNDREVVVPWRAGWKEPQHAGPVKPRVPGWLEP